MSGHNKWAQIKHKKAITDRKKGQIFSKLSREITLIARDNPDPETNYRLKTVVNKARSLNMPQDNIDRAIKRVADRNQAALEQLQLEAVGPGGAAIIINAITDNRNRTINELKTLLNSLGLKSVPPGSLKWMMNSPVTLNDDDRQNLERIIDSLDEHDDIQEVHTNARI